MTQSLPTRNKLLASHPFSSQIKRDMILIEVLWSLVSLLVHYYQVLRKATPMALQYSTSTNSLLSWKRFAESPSLVPPKRLKGAKGSMSDATLPSMEINGEAGEEARALRKKEKKRPARIEIPKSCVRLELGEAGKKEGLVEEGFEVGGSGHWLASRKGTRHAMEDGYGVATNINGDSKQAFFGVFDGHGGRAAVDFVSETLGKNVIRALGELQHEDDDYLELAVRAAYLATDREFLSQGVRSGACVATVLIRDGELVAANVGDCRVVASKNGVAEALTNDHRAGREDERTRIEKCGGYVNCHNGVWRVQDSLAVSRAIGDGSMKKWVISEPETTRLQLTPNYEFIILASDGLWDKVSNQEAVDIVLRHEKSIKSCKVLADLAASRGSRDDVTVMVVDLQSFLVE